MGWTQQGHNILHLFSKAPREAPRPTQPLVQWVQRVLSAKMKWLGHEIGHSPTSRAEIKMGEAVTLLLPCLHSVHRDSFTLLWWFKKYKPFIITIINHISHIICVYSSCVRQSQTPIPHVK
jgi:hypothetical protein